jgi:hypothetical protein
LKEITTLNKKNKNCNGDINNNKYGVGSDSDSGYRSNFVTGSG